MRDYEKDYEEFWKPIIEEGGVLDLDKLKRELYDYHKLMQNVSEIYDYVTGGVISKPFTLPIHVKNEADRHYREVYTEEGN